VELGNKVTWTMVVTNNGPDTATGVTIADPMPSGNTFVSPSTTQGPWTGGPILHCDLGTIPAEASVTITLVTSPSTAGTRQSAHAAADVTGTARRSRVCSPIAGRPCNTKRVGVTNVFTPPVTG